MSLSWHVAGEVLVILQIPAVGLCMGLVKVWAVLQVSAWVC